MENIYIDICIIVKLLFAAYSSDYGFDSKSNTIPSDNHMRSEKSQPSQKLSSRSHFGTFPRKKKERSALRNR